MTRQPARADSREAFVRLMATLAIMTIGASAMYVVPVILPAVQAEFGVPRAQASAPYSLLMIGYGVGGLFMGRLADRRGLVIPLVIGAISLGAGYLLAASAQSLGVFTLAHALLMGLFGSSVTFSPLLADTSLWWHKRRGIAVAVCASGNYLGGAIWPPVVQHFVESVGWRSTYTGMGVGCCAANPPADNPGQFGRSRPRMRSGGDRWVYRRGFISVTMISLRNGKQRFSSRGRL